MTAGSQKYTNNRMEKGANSRIVNVSGALHELHQSQPQADMEPSFTMSHNAIIRLPDLGISSKCLVGAVWQCVCVI